MKEKILKNSSLKIVSIVIAVFIWLFATNANDPIDTKSYSVKVSITNDSYLNELGKTYQIEDENRSVTVYVQGRSSVISNRNDLVVEADLTQIVDMNTDPTYVPVQLKPASGISMENVTIIPQTIPVYIEDIAEKDFMITVNTEGTPGTGYDIGECVANPEKVTIQGPESTINKIKSVVATINVSGWTTDTEKKAELKIIDQNGETMTEDAMDLLTIFNVGEERTVDVSVKLWRIVDDVKIAANYSGIPAYGYQVDKVTMTPETISVAGSEEALKELKDNHYTVTIPPELISVDGAKQDIETNIKLTSILKEEDGYKIPSDMTQSISVRISILPYGSKEYTVNSADIQVQGLEEGLRVSFMQNKVTVRIKADNTNLQILSTDQIQTSLNLEGLEAGEHTVPVNVILPDGYELVEDAAVTVQLTKSES